MMEIAKSVKARLRQPAVAGSHPEAEQLNAFVEQALGVPEREQVLVHLAACATCREIVALSLPEPEVMQTVFAPARGNWWQRAGVLSWGAAAAAVIVVASTAYVMRPPAQPETASVAIRQPATTGTVAKLEPSPPPPAAAAEPRRTVPAVSRSFALRADAASAAAAKSNAAPAELSKRAEAKELADAAPSGAGSAASSGGDAVAAAAAPVVAEERERGADKKDAAPSSRLASAPPAPAEEVTVAEMNEPAAASHLQAQRAAAKQKIEVLPVARGGAAFTDNAGKVHYGFTGVYDRSMSSGAAWRVNDGKLQRSEDQGAHWTTVLLGRPLRATAYGLRLREIWVGGEDGTVMHSVDGSNWAQAHGGWKPAKVKRIVFSDPQRGSIHLSSGETWVTSDGGATWVATADARTDCHPVCD